jgi:hypothetical protein
MIGSGYFAYPVIRYFPHHATVNLPERLIPADIPSSSFA